MKLSLEHRTKPLRASLVRTLGIGVALAFSLVNGGCVGLAGSPNSGTAGAGPGAPPPGSQPSQLSPSSSQVSFGNVTVGSSTSQLVTLTAAGTTNVTISKVSTSGAGFSVSGGSNVILTPNQSVTISLSFQPTAAGSATGNLLVTSNASNSTLQIALSGSGIAAAGHHSVALQWQASTSAVIGYLVFRGATASNLSQLKQSTDSSTSYTDTSVADGQTYVYAVKSVDFNNVMSDFSNMVTVTIPSQ